MNNDQRITDDEHHHSNKLIIKFKIIDPNIFKIDNSF
ncbi:unnamed protein product, partial [Rotaria sordida]